VRVRVQRCFLRFFFFILSNITLLNIYGACICSDTMSEQEKFVLPKEHVINRDALVLTFSMALRLLPQRAERFDPNRMTLLHFCVGGLDLLSALDDKMVMQKRKDIIEWVYRQQVLHHQTIEKGEKGWKDATDDRKDMGEMVRAHYGGFTCGPSVPENCVLNEGHVGKCPAKHIKSIGKWIYEHMYNRCITDV
jgi:hypothetical protein